MQTTRTKQVIWDPAGSNRFIIGGGSDLRLMEWEHTPSSSRFNTVAACTDLGQVRSFAWSPHASYPDLVALGTYAGKVLLLRLDSSPSASSKSNHGGHSALQINLRHSRPCNVVTFSQDRPRLVAVGLEKGRGESLLIYDIEQSAQALDSGKDKPSTSSHRRSQHGTQRSRGNSPSRSSSANGNSSAGLIEPSPLLSLGPSESVSAAGFLYADSAVSATSPPVVAGMSGKWLRVYDLRSPTAPIASWGSRAALSISPNPSQGNQFVSAGDDGVIRLWDMRKPMDALLSWSEIDAGALSSRQRSSVQPRGIVEMEWNLSKAGELTTLERESHTLRVWDLLDGPSAVQMQHKQNAGVLGMEGNMNTNEQGSTPGSESIQMPVLFDDRRPKAFAAPLTSFTYAISPLHPKRTQFLGISRDTATPGNSGHRLEVIEMPRIPHAAFLEDGMLLSSDAGLECVRMGPAPVGSRRGSLAADDDEDEDSPTRKVNALLDRGRSLSLSSIVKVIDRNQTPRPGGPKEAPLQTSGGSVTPRGASRTREAAQKLASELATNIDNLEGLRSDVSMLYRERLARGYGSNPMKNASLAESSSLGEFWTWIARAEALSHDGLIQDYDFRYRGVMSILSGFPSSSAAAANPGSPGSSPTQHTAQRKLQTHAANTSSRSIYSEFHRSLRERREEHSPSSSSRGKAPVTAAAFVAASGLLVSRRKLDAMSPISSSSFSSQRKLATQVCGTDWEREAGEVCAAYDKHGDHEKAARHAFFSGHLESAIGYLQGCKAYTRRPRLTDEKLRLLAPLLAAFIAQKSTNGSEGAFADLCRTLSSDAYKPWVRGNFFLQNTSICVWWLMPAPRASLLVALFAYMASGEEWREVVEETGLPLKDRVAIALRFLPDNELLSFVQGLAKEARTTADLEAVVLFGLRDAEGISLLSSYIDRTSDLQTVAIAAAFISPGILRNDLQLRRWIEGYRSHLDRLQLYAARAVFDGARGRRARASIEQDRVGGRTNEANEVESALRKLAPPQIVIRCQFCATNLGPFIGLSTGENEGRSRTAPVGVKSTLCPSCSKGLPACAVCLKKPNLHSIPTDISSSLCWCQKCRHGGHTNHMLEWFERSVVCPVADCDCECRAGDESD
ncbi:BZ3500_MvSof-1268-A1-R1_Chr5-3g08312 [Microbotryum saponariae]|uniref:BZ3500_MvSof-1268-A1-R1_Chr5-3g08312 protein n=1 Tax=Microbotryum saponariae TaxID=289078 RepID=A0A2X0LS18_9BASI|nr:BZ3500_MvSof-1268-A1-R1_Chr5-3g08312 [Microbotryum saponariae]SDA08420.1 BZ3501_MvSof-1269-A2-R1_Chr5-3g08040 [Microbotryum saponariae]